MESGSNDYQVYKELAEWYERRGPASMRDRFLVLAADAALAEGDAEAAERLRARLVQANPHHLVKPYTSFAQALRSADVQTYVHDLRYEYPPEAARQLLQSLRDGAAHAAPAIPPTAPLIHFDEDDDDEGATHLEPAPDLLKVFPLRDEADQTEVAPPPRSARPRDATPPPRSAPTARPGGAPAAPSGRSSTAAHRRPAPLPPAVQAPHRPPALPPPSAGPDEYTGGGWLGVALFGLVCVGGVLLAGYALLRPFLPAGWLP
jgi:hypothetical protein